MLSGFFLSLHFFSWIQSLEYVPVSASVIVVNSSPLWVIFLSFIFFREVINRKQLLGLLLSLMGVFVIASEDTTDFFPDTFQEGVILALFGAIMVAFYLMIGKRMRSRYNVGNIPYTYFVNLFCTLFLFIYSLLLSEEVWVFPVSDLIWFLSLAIGPSLLGHALYSYAMKRLSAQVVSLSVLGEAVGASILSIIFLSEILTERILIGGLLIGMGIIIALYAESRNENFVRV
jgi:drug/metabolite transporter (DMT)-like permease